MVVCTGWEKEKEIDFVPENSKLLCIHIHVHILYKICAYARARACVCVCVCVHANAHTHIPWTSHNNKSLHSESIIEIYTFKMMQETNAAYLELHTHTSQQKNSQRSVSNYPSDCYCYRCAPLIDAASFENGYTTTKQLVCSTVSK